VSNNVLDLLGQYVEIERDVVFTVDYEGRIVSASIRARFRISGR
jgi:myosin-crossreactive antigen